ncbi:MAG: DUF2304 domain-containing protein [Nocardioidaceae bacterium]|nr:DUF2304 domain-containing protein [Nocardioidaceae bacterium]
MIIKILLITGALGFGVLVLRDRGAGHHLLLRRLAGLTVVVLGIIAVLWPLLTTRVANAIGVGRGTDLVLYVLVMVFIYSAVATSQRIHRLERTVTMLVRELALRDTAGPVRDDSADVRPNGEERAS